MPNAEALINLAEAHEALSQRIPGQIEGANLEQMRELMAVMNMGSLCAEKLRTLAVKLPAPAAAPTPA